MATPTRWFAGADRFRRRWMRRRSSADRHRGSFSSSSSSSSSSFSSSSFLPPGQIDRLRSIRSAHSIDRPATASFPISSHSSPISYDETTMKRKKTAQAAQHPREKKWRFSNERSRIISSQRDLFNRMILSIEGAKRKLLPPVSTTHNSMSNRWLKKLLINICKVNEQPVSIKITNDHFCLYLRIEWKYISNICFLGTVILNET